MSSLTSYQVVAAISTLFVLGTLTSLKAYGNTLISSEILPGGYPCLDVLMN